eukprot:12850727-Alexandrium_andersonii.AAC.1
MPKAERLARRLRGPGVARLSPIPMARCHHSFSRAGFYGSELIATRRFGERAAVPTDEQQSCACAKNSI